MIRPDYEYAIRSHHRVGTDLHMVSPCVRPVFMQVGGASLSSGVFALICPMPPQWT